MKRHLAAAAALVVLVNAFALAGVAWNRSGEPEAVVELTEREFHLPWSAATGREREDTGLSLGLSWNDGWEHDAWRWLDAALLADLGFDTSVPPDDSAGTSEFYRRQAPRRAFVALEMEGHAWRRWLSDRELELADLAARVERGEEGSEELERRTAMLERHRIEHSRLFVIDAARDPADLRGRHPDRSRVFILPARIAISHWALKEGARIGGRIEGLLISRLQVPLRHRPVLDRAIADRQAARESPVAPAGPPPAPPGWAITVAFGRRLEPWIVSVQSLRD